jgi:hypothetical protein
VGRCALLAAFFSLISFVAHAERERSPFLKPFIPQPRPKPPPASAPPRAAPKSAGDSHTESLVYDFMFTRGDFIINDASGKNVATSAYAGEKFRIVSSNEKGKVISFEDLAKLGHKTLYFLPKIYGETYALASTVKNQPSMQDVAYFVVKNPDAIPPLYRVKSDIDESPPLSSLSVGEKVRIVISDEKKYEVEIRGHRYAVFFNEGVPENWLEDENSFKKNQTKTEAEKKASTPGSLFVWKDNELPPGVSPNVTPGDLVVRDSRKANWGIPYHVKDHPEQTFELSADAAKMFLAPYDGKSTPAQLKTAASAHKSKIIEEPPSGAPSSMSLSRQQRFDKVMEKYNKVQEYMKDKPFYAEAKKVCAADNCGYKKDGKRDPNNCMSPAFYREALTWLRGELSQKSPDPLFPWGASGVFSLMITAYGEARDLTNVKAAKGQEEVSIHDPMTRANMLGVMKTIDNRRIANLNRDATDMKVATQDRQYSTWNRLDPNFACMLVGSEKKAMAMAASAYVDYLDPETKFKGGFENNNNVFHYHANSMNTEWDSENLRIKDPIVELPPPPPGGSKISLNTNSKTNSHHTYYQGVKWSYSNKIYDN